MESTLAENEVNADAKAIVAVGRAKLVSALLVLAGDPAPPAAATMAAPPLLIPRLDALQFGKRPAVRLPLYRLIISAVLVVALLATAGWLPHYRPSRVVRSMPTVVLHVPIESEADF